MAGGLLKEWEIKYIGGIIPREFLGMPIFATDDTFLNNTEIKVIDGIMVAVKTYEYKKVKRLYNEVQSCDTKRDELSLAYNEWDYGFEEYQTYSIKNKVFAYEINHWAFESGTKKELGVGYINIYIQEEENGTFKLVCPDKYELDSIPEWVKDMAKRQ